MPPIQDVEFVQILDHALADATHRAGAWLVCRPGCDACCQGVFAISSLDAQRLNHGYKELQKNDPARAERVERRIAEAKERLSPDFPGDAAIGVLGTDADSKDRFDDFANEERCPILDPGTGTCDLYDHRPVTCRIFGPPVRSEDGLGVCELCFQGASEAEISRCEMHLPNPELEEELTKPLGDWQTIVAFAIREPSSRQSHPHPDGLMQQR